MSWKLGRIQQSVDPTESLKYGQVWRQRTSFWGMWSEVHMEASELKGNPVRIRTEQEAEYEVIQSK